MHRIVNKRISRNEKSLRQKLNKAKLNRKLIYVNSAGDYTHPVKNDSLVISGQGDTTNGMTPVVDNTAYIQDEDEGDEVESEKQGEEQMEDMLSNNPEDCKDTIFSGEGEILGTAGETDHKTSDMQALDNDNLTSDEKVQVLLKENKQLRQVIRKMVVMFTKFKQQAKRNTGSA